MWFRIRARKRPSVRMGPFRYFQNWSASYDRRRGARGGMTSQGASVDLGWFGRLTYNLTTGRKVWDYPGPGSMEFGTELPPPPPMPRRRRTR